MSGPAAPWARARFTARIRPMTRAFLRDIGAVGTIGLVLLACAPPAWWLLVQRPHQEAADIRVDIARLRTRRIGAAERAAEPTAQAQLERFRAAFPDAATMPAALTELSRLAGANRVVLASGDYRLAEERPLGMLRYEVRYPVKGAWRDVFMLLAALLNEVPNLALDEVVFKRESQGAAEVDAQLRLSLFFVDAGQAPGFRAQPASAAPVRPRRGGADG